MTNVSVRGLGLALLLFLFYPRMISYTIAARTGFTVLFLTIAAIIVVETTIGGCLNFKSALPSRVLHFLTWGPNKTFCGRE